jgi:hypothetical protein
MNSGVFMFLEKVKEGIFAHSLKNLNSEKKGF